MNERRNKVMMNGTHAGARRTVVVEKQPSAVLRYGQRSRRMGDRSVGMIGMGKLLRVALLVVLAMSLSLAQGLAAAPNGDIIYNNNTTTPQSRVYASSSNTFAAAAATITGAIPTFIVNKHAPNRNERLVGYVTTAGVFYLYRWDGASWINETSAAGGWGGTVTVGGDGVNGRRFDIEYEFTTGRAMVVYSANATGTNELRYRIWDGATWTAATNLDSARITGIPASIKLRARHATGSNQIALLVAGSGTATANTAQLSSLIWSGSAWGNEPGAAHTTALISGASATASITNDCFDQAWEEQSGDLLVVYTMSTPQQYYREYKAGVWQAAVSYASARAAPIQMIAVSNPFSDEILVAWARSSLNVSANVWTGTANGTTTSAITNALATTAINKKHLAGAWVRSGSTDAAVLVSARPAATAQDIPYNYYIGGAWGTQATWATGVTITSGNATWMDLDADPDPTNGSNELLLTFSDTNLDLWAKRLIFTAPNTFTWSNADGGTALTATLTAVTAQNFDFSYDAVVDSTPPTEGTLSVTPQSGTFVPGTFTITETFTEAQSKVSSCEYTVDGTLWAAGTVSGASSPYTCTASNVVAANGASLTIKMRATSKGGTSTPSNTLTRTVDALAPVTTDSYPGGSVTVDQNITLSATDGSGVGGSANTGGTTKYCTTAACNPATGTTYSGTPISLTGVAGAKTVHYLRYFSTDALSNAETVKETIVTIDKRTGTEVLPLTFGNVMYDSITVYANFSGDTNGNNNCTIKWGTVSGTYPNTATATRSGNAYVAVVTELSVDTLYYFQATFGETTPDTILAGTNPALGNQRTTKLLLMHNSSSTDSKYTPAWGAAYTCATCHVSDAPNVKRIRAQVDGTGRALSVTNVGNGLATWASTEDKVCDACHTKTLVYRNSATAAGVNVYHPAETDPNGKNCIYCHKHKKGFKVQAGCKDCHDNNNGSPVYVIALAPKVIDVAAGNYGSHMKFSATDSPGAATDWDKQCQMCHDGHASVVQIPKNTTVGINYAAGIGLGGTKTSGSTEAEICWNCHDANGVSEWGTDDGAVNNTKPANNSDYDYGSLYTTLGGTTKTSNWVAGFWSSGKGRASSEPFWYKRGAVQSTHTANPAVTDAALSGAAYGKTETPNAVAQIRCSYCHDVHNTGAVNGAPYLRGTWVRNPYPEDGAPQAGMNNWSIAGIVGYNYGLVPRASASATNTGITAWPKTGGYWIDQNSGDPNSAITTVGQHAGLCILCHTGGVDTLDQVTGENLWVSNSGTGNGHMNSVIGGTGTTNLAYNIFTTPERGSSTVNSGSDAAPNYYPNMGGYSETSDRLESYRGTADSALMLTPNVDGSLDSGRAAAFQRFEWGTSKTLSTPAIAAGTLQLIVDGGTGSASASVDAATTQSQYHTFTCSKCHNPHASRLPKLMITNCLDTRQNTWDDAYGTAPVATPAPWTSTKASQWPSAQNCHRLTDNSPADATRLRGEGWNKVTPW